VLYDPNDKILYFIIVDWQKNDGSHKWSHIFSNY
jgi:hypothetical protein